jgi:glycosyltransferase involved in cell wall biosynthesis
VALGHQVTLFASGDSLTAAELRAPWGRALRLDPTIRDPIAPHVHMLTQVYRQASEFDVIHCHTEYLGLPFARWARTPTIVTLHGRLDIPEVTPLFRDHPEVPLVSISDAQRAAMPWASWVATVQHGLPPDLYRPAERVGDYLLFLGRVSPEKRPDAAIRIAVRAGVPLKMAAKVDVADRAYHESVVRPLLAHPLVEFLGEVDDERKAALLAGARALLFPIDWPEPFGLVMLEALACGTPVVARRRGSVPEVLRSGVTAWLGETDDELVEAVRRLDQLDRAACRTEFERRFTDRHMARRYLDVYGRVLAGRRAAADAPDAAGRPLVTAARRDSSPGDPVTGRAAGSRGGGA